MTYFVYLYRAEYPDGSVYEGNLTTMARHFGVTPGKVKVAYLARKKTLEEAFSAPAGVRITRRDTRVYPKDPRREAKFTSNPVLRLTNGRAVYYLLGKYYIYHGNSREYCVTDPAFIDTIDLAWGV